MEALLKIEDLCLSFFGKEGSVQAVKGASLHVEPGETLALVGQSGCGKTALCRSVLMLHRRHARIESGKIFLCGREVSSLTERELDSMRGTDAAMIFQDPLSSLDPVMPVGRQIMEPMRFHQGVGRREAQRRAMELLERVGIDRPQERFRQYPHHFSGGMRQRAAIAVALAADPRLIIADEPTTALDPATEEKIMALLKSAAEESGRGMLFVTHDLRLAQRTADRVAVMKDGVILETGRTEELFLHPRHPYTRELVELAGGGVPRAADRAEQSDEKTDGAGDVRESEPAEPLVSVCNLTKTFWSGSRRSHTVLSDLSLTVARGEILGIAGTSGCGKSTLARCIMGLYEPDGGEIRFAEGCRKQMIFQDSASAFNPRMTLAEIIAEPLVIKKVRDKELLERRVREMMEQVELEWDLKDRQPYAVSGGQRQRAAIARALITDPDFIVADEPVSSLDLPIQFQIVKLLARLQRERNMSIMFITHDVPLIRGIADRIITL